MVNNKILISVLVSVVLILGIVVAGGGVVSHEVSEINVPSSCTNGEVLTVGNSGWICATASGGGLWTSSGSGIKSDNAVGILIDADPTIALSAKNSHSPNHYGYLGLLDAGVKGEYGDETSGTYGLLGSRSGGAYGKDKNTGSFGRLGWTSYGVYGDGSSKGVYGIGINHGVYGENDEAGNYGFLGGNGYGVYGRGGTYGVYGNGGTYGVYGYSSEGYAGYFNGKVKIKSYLRVDSQISSGSNIVADSYVKADYIKLRLRSSEPVDCNSNNRGVIYYDTSGNGNLMLCNDLGNWMVVS